MEDNLVTWFVLETNGTVGFRLGAYDARLLLIIDPVIVTQAVWESRVTRLPA